MAATGHMAAKRQRSNPPSAQWAGIGGPTRTGQLQQLRGSSSSSGPRVALEATGVGQVQQHGSNPPSARRAGSGGASRTGRRQQQCGSARATAAGDSSEGLRGDHAATGQVRPGAGGIAGTPRHGHMAAACHTGSRSPRARGRPGAARGGDGSTREPHQAPHGGGPRGPQVLHTGARGTGGDKTAMEAEAGRQGEGPVGSTPRPAIGQGGGFGRVGAAAAPPAARRPGAAAAAAAERGQHPGRGPSQRTLMDFWPRDARQ